MFPFICSIVSPGKNCNPTCSEGATCDNSWGYARCICPAGFLGVDCSIRKTVLPCQDHLKGYWPLVGNHVDVNESFVDIWASNHAVQMNRLFAPYHSPFYPNGSALINFRQGSAQPVGMPTFPIIHGATRIMTSSFLISAFVRFDDKVNVDTLYPLVTFADPAPRCTLTIFISKSGRVVMQYPDASTASDVTVEVSASNVIGTVTPRSFVVVQFDASTGNLTAGTLEYDTMLLVYGEGGVVQPWPKFGVASPSYMEIGKAVIAMPGGAATRFAGEIACLSVHDHTLPPYQTTLLIETCWDVLGGPKAVETPAHPLCDEIPQCFDLPNITGASIVTMHPHPPVYMEIVQDNYYTNNTIVSYVCDYGYTLVGTVRVEMNVTCNMSQWAIPYTHCEPNNLQTSPLSIEFVNQFQDPPLLKYLPNITDAVEVAAELIPLLDDSPTVKIFAVSKIQLENFVSIVVLFFVYFRWML